MTYFGLLLQIAEIPVEERRLMTDTDSVNTVNDEYFRRMNQPGEWGDGIVLAYACRLFKRQIKVLMTNRSIITFADHQSADDPQLLLLGFVKTIGSATENHYVYLSERKPFEHNNSSLEVPEDVQDDEDNDTR